MHEAGHAVIAQVLQKVPASISAKIFDGDQGGYCQQTITLPPIDDGVQVAAGPAAQRLAHRHPEPTIPPLPPTPTPEPTTAAEIRQAAVETIAKEHGQSDAQKIAALCIQWRPDDPSDWKNMYHYFHSEARRLVAEHESEIIEVARELHRTGFYQFDPHDAEQANQTTGDRQ